jgi:hypothetical protein
MDVKTISMSENEAEDIYKQYLEVVKTRKEKYLKDLKKVYHALKNGKKVIDIYEAFKKTGVKEDGNPKLAIAQAHLGIVQFDKEVGGGGIFGEASNWRKERVIDVRLPGNTFDWKTSEGKMAERWTEISNPTIRTNVPLIPAHLLPEGKLENYYILWEVDEWKTIAKAVDPFLLKRINANTFIVLAEWDLTEVEQIVMRGE